jgi:Protein of unknown function (DUF4238)
MSVQKPRTPKGLAHLAHLTKLKSKNVVLLAMQRFQNLHCAIWAESVWAIAEAENCATKFIVSDHPVSVYNEDCFPNSVFCRGFNDPEIWRNGSHTIFPLSPTKVLILTNLSWVRNPYGNANRLRPNPNPLRTAMFKFTDIQI